MLSVIKQYIGTPGLYHVLLVGELKNNTANNRLGFLWWFLDPLAMMAVFYFVVQVVFKRGGEDYHLFILSALLAWQWFARSLTGSANAIAGAAGLLSRTRVPPGALILVPIIANGMFALVGLLLVKLISGTSWGMQTLWVFPGLLVQMLLSAGIGTLLATLTPVFPDIRRMLGFITRAWWFLSPVLYDASRVMDASGVPQWAKTAFMMNPMTVLLPIYRWALLDRGTVYLDKLPVLAVISFVLLVVSIFVLRWALPRIMKMV